jgi:uncharacterized protein
MKSFRPYERVKRTTSTPALVSKSSAREIEIQEELISMAQHATEERTQTHQPFHDAQVKGGQQSQQDRNKAGGMASQNQPSHEAQVKGGQHSHQGNQNASDRSDDRRTENQPSHEAQVKGGQHSHSGGSNR